LAAVSKRVLCPAEGSAHVLKHNLQLSGLPNGIFPMSLPRFPTVKHHCGFAIIHPDVSWFPDRRYLAAGLLMDGNTKRKRVGDNPRFFRSERLLSYSGISYPLKGNTPSGKSVLTPREFYVSHHIKMVFG
jgi:hypothetical protein